MNTKPIFDDSLDGLFGGPTVPRSNQTAARPAPEDFVEQRLFTEPCSKCRGTGNWRPGYPCFACKGLGKNTFKTSPAQRAQARGRTAEKKVAKLEEQKAWRETHKVELAWLDAQFNRQTANAHQGRKVWNLPISLSEGLAQYGTLTDNQINLIRGCMERDVERAEQRKVEQAQASTDIDVSKIDAAFEKARVAAHEAGAEGVRWLKLRLDTFVFLDMPAKGQWKAAIRVTEGHAKLGRIEAGKFVRSRDCTDEQLTRILAAAADPAAAAKAYGERYSSCSCCGRELTNPMSIKLGIGPWCAAKWGFLAEGIEPEGDE